MTIYPALGSMQDDYMVYWFQKSRSEVWGAIGDMHAVHIFRDRETYTPRVALEAANVVPIRYVRHRS